MDDMADLAVMGCERCAKSVDSYEFCYIENPDRGKQWSFGPRTAAVCVVVAGASAGPEIAFPSHLRGRRESRQKDS